MSFDLTNFELLDKQQMKETCNYMKNNIIVIIKLIKITCSSIR